MKIEGVSYISKGLVGLKIISVREEVWEEVWEEVVLLVVLLVLVLVFLVVVLVIAVVIIAVVEVDKPVEDLLFSFRVKWIVQWLVSLGLKRCEQRYLFIISLALVEYKVMWISSVVKSVSCIGRKVYKL